MLIHFETNDLSQRDAQCLLNLLAPLAGKEAPHNVREKEAVRREVKPGEAAVLRGVDESVQSLSRQIDEDVLKAVEEPVKRKPGRPKKEQAAEVPEGNPTAAPTVENPSAVSTEANGSVHPAPQSSGSEPVTLDHLRDAINNHVASKGMPSAQLVFSKFGCQRASQVLELPAEKQQEFLAAMGK